MGLSKEVIEEFKETYRPELGNEIKVQLTYKSSPEANFRLFKALSMLINEEDIINYFQKSLGEGEALKRKKQPNNKVRT